MANSPDEPDDSLDLDIDGVFGEIEEWDKMFDSLHEETGPGAASASAPSEETEEPPPSEPATPSADDFLLGPAGGEAQRPKPASALDIALGPSGMSPFAGEGEDESDFESPFIDQRTRVGSAEDIERLLRQRPEQVDEAIDETEAIGDLLGSGPIRAPEELFTSVRAPLPSSLSLGMKSSRVSAPADDDFGFDESTSIMSAGLVERMAESAAAFFEEEEPPAVSFEVDDDFYDGIEIADESAGSEFLEPQPSTEPAITPLVSPAAATPRGRAHVVRRDLEPDIEPDIESDVELPRFPLLSPMVVDDEEPAVADFQDNPTAVGAVPEGHRGELDAARSPAHEEVTAVRALLAEEARRAEPDDSLEARSRRPTSVREGPRRPDTDEPLDFDRAPPTSDGIPVLVGERASQQVPFLEGVEETDDVDVPGVSMEELSELLARPSAQETQVISAADVLAEHSDVTQIVSAADVLDERPDATQVVAARDVVAELDLEPVAAVPEPIAPQRSAGVGVLRTEEPGPNDSIDLALEIDDAVDELVFETPAVVRDIAPALDGVVEAAVEDAVAMSTGTLLTGPQLGLVDVEPELPAAKFGLDLPPLNLDAIAVPEQVEPERNNRTDELASLLMLYERELRLLDQPGPTAQLRIEAGRLAEALGDLDSARAHLDEALKIDPRLVPATRALRRIERALGNWGEVINQLDNERAKASPMEQRALAAYRADLLIAMGELDVARVAVGELLDTTPSDLRALLANLELAFVDGREDEVDSTLQRLSEVLSDPALRSSLVNVRAGLAVRAGDVARAGSCYAASAESSPNLMAGLGRAAMAGRTGDVGAFEGALAAEASTSNDLNRLAALQWVRGQKLAAAGRLDAAAEAFEQSCAAKPADAHAWTTAGRVADERVASGSLGSEIASNLWSRAGDILAVGPASAHAYLRAARHAGQPEGVLQKAREADPTAATPGDVSTSDLSRAAILVEQPGGSERQRFLAAAALAEGGELDAALRGLSERGGAAAVLAARLCAAYPERRARVLMAMAQQAWPGVDEDACWRQAARFLTVAAAAEPALAPEVTELWSRVAQAEPRSMAAAAIAGMLSVSLPASPTSQAALDLARDRAGRGASAVQWAIEEALRSVQAGHSRSATEALHALLAAQPGEFRIAEVTTALLGRDGAWDAAACLLEELARADQGASAVLYYRAAILRSTADEQDERVLEDLRLVCREVPGFAAARDRLATLEGRLGVGPVVRSEGAVAAMPALDDLASAIRRAEQLASAGDVDGAMHVFRELLRRHVDDPVVRQSFEAVAIGASETASLAELALSDLRAAEERGDTAEQARALAQLARIDGELRGDPDSALMSWASASRANPSRQDLLRILEREYMVRGSAEGVYEDLREVLGRVVSLVADPIERCAYHLERGRLGERFGISPAEVVFDYQSALTDEPKNRMALMFLESYVSRSKPASEELAGLEDQVAAYFENDARARAAFLVRSGETLLACGKKEQALAHFKEAVEVVPGFAPALMAWHETALDHGLWSDLAESCIRQAAMAREDQQRADLYHLAGVVYMDKALDGERAADALRRVLVADPAHRDAFVRLRLLLDEAGRAEDLARLLTMRLDVETEPKVRCELHHALAGVQRNFLDDRQGARSHLRKVLELRPNDKEAIVDLSDLAWELGDWADAAETLLARARLESDPDILKGIFFRLGTIYADRLPDPKWALRSFQKVLSLDAADRVALARVADLAVRTEDWRLALGACEKYIKLDPPIEEKVEFLHRIAEVYERGFQDRPRAERALRVALDLDPTSAPALARLLEFYRSGGDLRSTRVHIDRVAAAMRARLDKDLTDAAPYAVIASSLAAREDAGVVGSAAVARAAAQMALLLGDTTETSRALAEARRRGPSLRLLCTTEQDDLLFPRAASSAVRALFQLLGDRLAKHIGMDVRRYGAGRGDRLRKSADPIASLILEMAADMAIDDVDVYVTAQEPAVVAAIATQPVSLVLGSQLASAERPEELRFWVARSLKLASGQLAGPLQLGVDRFGVLLVGLLRQFQPTFLPPGIDEQAADSEQQRLRRLIPSNMLNELAPYALSLAGEGFDHKDIWASLQEAGDRAGLVASGSLRAALSALLRQGGYPDIRSGLQADELARLVRFAVSEDHALLFAALQQS